MNIIGLISTLMTVLGDLPKAIQAIQFLMKAITDAEKTGVSGPDKLTMVLNDFESAINVFNPTWAGTFDTIAKDVESAVNEIVSIYNDFAHSVPAKT